MGSLLILPEVIEYTYLSFILCRFQDEMAEMGVFDRMVNFFVANEGMLIRCVGY